MQTLPYGFLVRSVGGISACKSFRSLCHDCFQTANGRDQGSI